MRRSPRPHRPPRILLTHALLQEGHDWATAERDPAGGGARGMSSLRTRWGIPPMHHQTSRQSHPSGYPEGRLLVLSAELFCRNCFL